MKIKTVARLFFIAVFFLSDAAVFTCFAQQKKELKVLFVGNSYIYYNNLPEVVSIISDSTHTKLVCKKITYGGARLSDHWLGKWGLQTVEAIKNGNFDIVVLQEWSLGTVTEPDSFYKYVRLFCKEIKNSGAKPYLYVTWSREKVPQQQEDINRIYANAAKENDAVLVPVGSAWALARQLRPAVQLFAADGSHPGNLGTYLTAAVFVKKISGELPENFPYELYTKKEDGESIRLMEIDPMDIDFFKRVIKQLMGDAN